MNDEENRLVTTSQEDEIVPTPQVSILLAQFACLVCCKANGKIEEIFCGPPSSGKNFLCTSFSPLSNVKVQ